ncbi:MAG TPA: phosphate ABC transporter permease subunit PstC [Methanomicrobiales archaeon]|nr:phosphate ABC transporter permease subunit PstC [Methanomicrobiales archaeon]
MDRERRDRIVNHVLFVPAILSSVVLFVMAGILLLKSEQILSITPLLSLLLSSSWRPLAGQFGFLPFIMGTIWVTGLAMAISIPVSLLSAIYLSEYAHAKVRGVIQPLIDLLAGVPSVVYGLFGILLIVPLIKEQVAPFFGTTSSGYCVLAGGLILAIMVFPILISLTFEVLRTVPLEMREASLGIGATRWETIKHVVLRKASPGILAVIILGFSRAFGETMAVLMVVGNVARVPGSVFDPAYPLPALIANNYGEMMSIPVYDSALMFAALLLLVVVVIFNVAARLVLLRLRAVG